MYDAVQDSYCYQGTTVLKNLGNEKTQIDLDKFEILAVAKRAQEPLPSGKLDYAHYLAIHKHFFQDVYPWAGKVRTVRISKGGSMFCYPENIEASMRQLFEELAGDNQFRDLDAKTFAKKAAHFLSELNAIHPFREGNGRTQNTFLILLADQARHPLDIERLDPPEMMDAMVTSFMNGEGPLENLILELMRVTD